MLDTVGALMQLVGVYAVDTEERAAAEARHRADRWRRHLTTGLARPADDEPQGDAPATLGGGLSARDWEGAVRFATAERRAEHAYVTRTLEGLRGTVWALVRGLGEAVGEEAAAGERSRAIVGRLDAALASAPPEALRDAALAAVGELGSLLARREQERERRIAELGREVEALGVALEEARRDGMTDALTGLGNRRAFDEAMANAVTLGGLWRRDLCLILLDLDGLKALNDRVGHAAGDAALRQVAGQLARTFLGRRDVVARIGGDEFAVLLRDTTLTDGARLGQRLLNALAPSVAGGPPAPDGAEVRVSVGVAARRPGESGAELFARADAALYAAKHGGRARVETAP